MRTASFLAFLLGIALIFVGNSANLNTTPEAHQAVGLFLVCPGFLLMFFGAIIWVRLTILRWLIMFVARSWYQGKDQHYGRRGDRPHSLCTRNKAEA
jgi:hypothetical protein